MQDKRRGSQRGSLGNKGTDRLSSIRYSYMEALLHPISPPPRYKSPVYFSLEVSECVPEAKKETEVQIRRFLVHILLLP